MCMSHTDGGTYKPKMDESVMTCANHISIGIIKMFVASANE